MPASCRKPCSASCFSSAVPAGTALAQPMDAAAFSAARGRGL